MQSIARKNQWPLDKMALTVDVTKKSREDYGHPPREGAYIHGLYMEGEGLAGQNLTAINPFASQCVDLYVCETRGDYVSAIKFLLY